MAGFRASSDGNVVLGRDLLFDYPAREEDASGSVDLAAWLKSHGFFIAQEVDTFDIVLISNLTLNMLLAFIWKTKCYCLE